jgi:hypothetical protein
MLAPSAVYHLSKGHLMRFISPFAAYRIIAVHQKTEPLADGTRRVVSEGFTCEFKQSDTTDWERDEARKRFQFKGTTLYQDGTPVDPITRVSSFDTATIKDEGLRKRVEKALLENSDFGKQDGYILVEKPKLPAPWVTYDELTVHGQRKPAHVAAKNIETAKTTGVPLDHLVAYERQEQRKGWEEIVAAYEAASAETEQSEPEPELVEA